MTVQVMIKLLSTLPKDANIYFGEDETELFAEHYITDMDYEGNSNSVILTSNLKYDGIEDYEEKPELFIYQEEIEGER